MTCQEKRQPKSSLSLSQVFELKSIVSDCVNKPVIQRVKDAFLWLRLMEYCTISFLIKLFAILMKYKHEVVEIRSLTIAKRIQM